MLFTTVVTVSFIKYPLTEKQGFTEYLLRNRLVKHEKEVSYIIMLYEQREYKQVILESIKMCLDLESKAYASTQWKK